MKNKRQTGFSMVELLVAMMIITVIATLGMKKYQNYSANARYLTAQDTLKTVSEGLDQYFIKHGTFPDLSTFESMVDANSPLVKEDMIPSNVPNKDPWKNAFEAKSGKGSYVLKCNGDPNGSPDRPPFTREPGKIASVPDGDTKAAPEKGPEK